MTLKTLLLGSATAFAVVGGAQAADLSVAEPVDYVRICDAFGTGYWYIPGTDTCLKIGGYVQFDVNFHDTANESYVAPPYLAPPAGAPVAVIGVPHASEWDMNTEAGVSFSANSMTELGALKSYAEFRANSDNSSWNGGGNPAGQFLARLDSAWLSLGPFLAGRTGSVYDYGGGFNWDYTDYDPDNAADQVRLSWAMSGFGLAIGVEDPRDTWGTSLAGTYSIPNIVAAITTSQANWDGQLSAGYAETAAGSGFGAQAGITIKLDAIAPGDALRLKGAYATSEASAFGDGNGASWAGGSVWSALASFQHFWTPQLSSAATFDFRSESGGGIGGTQWEAAGNLVWSPVTGFLAGVEGGYIAPASSAPAGTNGTWKVKARVKRSF